MASKQEAEELVGINELALDRECIKQPQTYLRYSFLAAEKKRDVDEAKAELDVTAAELMRAMRKDPKKYGMEKVTESALKEQVITLPEYRESHGILLKKQHAYSMAQAVVGALDQKKRSLTLLVELHGKAYFADVKVTADGNEAVKKTTRSRSVRKPK